MSPTSRGSQGYVLCDAMFMRSYAYTRDIHKWVMFANYIFANITSLRREISSRENFQVHGKVK